jgi:hypothetical protein
MVDLFVFAFELLELDGAAVVVGFASTALLSYRRPGVRPL